jgi:putative membrane protein
MSAMGAWSHWSVDPAAVAAVAVAGGSYAAGLRRLWRSRRGRGASPLRALSFLGGLVALLAAVASPLDGAADVLLSAHMVQHLLLLAVAPPLLILGRPLVVGMQGLPEGLRRDARRLGRRPAVRAIIRAVTHPGFAWLLLVVVVWGWHVPAAYERAVSHPSLHALEHGTFLAAALLFWWPALEPGDGRRLPRGADVLYMLTTWLQSGALGALFTLAPAPVYHVYAVQALVRGGSALADQQVAGLIMWLPGGLIYLGAACAMFVGWLTASERTMQRVEARPRSGAGP